MSFVSLQARIHADESIAHKSSPVLNGHFAHASADHVLSKYDQLGLKILLAMPVPDWDTLSRQHKLDWLQGSLCWSDPQGFRGCKVGVAYTPSYNRQNREISIQHKCLVSYKTAIKAVFAAIISVRAVEKGFYRDSAPHVFAQLGIK